jgi:hypothetical protein
VQLLEAIFFAQLMTFKIKSTIYLLENLLQKINNTSLERRRVSSWVHLFHPGAWGASGWWGHQWSVTLVKASPSIEIKHNRGYIGWV